MGTHSLTIITESDPVKAAEMTSDDPAEVLVMYRQYDGYLGNHGKELAVYLDTLKIVNGLSMGPEYVANGVEELVALIVTYFKSANPYGNIYVHRAGMRDCGEKYIYIVGLRDGQPALAVIEPGWKSPDVLIFTGTPSEMLAWIASLETGNNTFEPLFLPVPVADPTITVAIPTIETVEEINRAMDQPANRDVDLFRQLYGIITELDNRGWDIKHCREYDD